MKKCMSCKIDFNTSEKLCPLCQNKLIGKQDEILFPENIRLKTNVLILKTIIFISLTIIILSSFIEYYITSKFNYTIIISLGLLTNLSIIYYILKNRLNISKMFAKYGVLLIILTLIWYIVTKEIFITNYIIPSLCIFELVFNTISSIILKNNYVLKYLDLILLNIIVLNVPFLLVLFNLTTYNLLAYICSVLSLITLIWLLIFYFSDIKEELEKIFNI